MGKNRFVSGVKKTIAKYAMVDKKDHIIMGISGGADSMALFFALLKLKHEYELTLSAVHVNHGIRGEQAKRDENFVRDCCHEFGVELEIYEFDIKIFSKEAGITEEEGGRLKRYEAYNDSLNVKNANKIAVAHNLNDQAETILMRMIRGTGSKGLSGIPAKRDNIIRPLIETSREDIEKYMNSNGFAYVDDSTNYEDIYTRNKIRLNLIPQIKEQFNSDIVNTLARSAQILADENNYIEDMAMKLYEKCSIKDDVDKVRINIEQLNQYHDVIKRRVLRKACFEVAGSLKDITYGHINDILNLAEKGTGKHINLPYNLVVEKSYSEIIFLKNTQYCEKDIYYIIMSDKMDFENIDKQTDADGLIEIKEGGIYVSISKDASDCQTLSIDIDDTTLVVLNKIYTKQFDYDKIVGNLQIRNRKPGDKIFLKGVGYKKISDYFIDEKIPRRDRESILLISDDSEILYVVGMRESEKYISDINTKNTMTLELWEED